MKGRARTASRAIFPAELRFTVFGAPQPKESARFGRGHAYTPPRTRAYALAVQTAALAECMRASWPRDERGSFAVKIALYVLPGGRQADVDNIAKALLDGMSRVVFRNDRDVVELSVRRHFDAVRPRAEIHVRPIDNAQLSFPTGAA